MIIKFTVSLRISRDRDEEETPEEIVSAASTTAATIDLAEDTEGITARRTHIGFGGAIG